MTNPLKPAQNTSSTSPSQQSIAPAPISPNPPATNQETASVTPTKMPPKVNASDLTVAGTSYRGPSPLQNLRNTSRTQPDPTPIKITVLNGQFRGQTFRMGQWLGGLIQQVDISGIAEWGESESNSIEGAANFNKLGSRTINLRFEFHDLNTDISHIEQNLWWLRAVDPELKTPPMVLIVAGDIQAHPCFLYQINSAYRHSMLSNRGFRVATMELSFKLQGGQNTKNALGEPLTSTPLQDWLVKNTEAQRQKTSLVLTTETLMAPCLGNGSTELEQLIQQNQLKEVESIAKLSANVFVQATIAGFFSPDLLQQEPLKSKLAADLASVVGANEEGVGIEGRAFAQAVVTGDPSVLSNGLQNQAKQAIEDYVVLYSAIAQQELNEDSPAVTGTSGDRMRRFGSCGLSMRQVGLGDLTAVASVVPSDPVVLQAINHRLGEVSSGAIPPSQVKRDFGLQKESQALILINGTPYLDTASFEARASAAVRKPGTLDGKAAFQYFAQAKGGEEGETLSQINEFFRDARNGAVETNAVQTAFDLKSQAQTAALIGAAPFSNRTEFETAYQQSIDSPEGKEGKEGKIAWGKVALGGGVVLSAVLGGVLVGKINKTATGEAVKFLNKKIVSSGSPSALGKSLGLGEEVATALVKKGSFESVKDLEKFFVQSHGGGGLFKSKSLLNRLIHELGSSL
jgi:hypothetical protein